MTQTAVDILFEILKHMPKFYVRVSSLDVTKQNNATFYRT